MIGLLLLFTLANADTFRVYSHDMYGNPTSGSIAQLKLSVVNAHKISFIIDTPDATQSFQSDRVFADRNKVCAEVRLLATNHKLSPVYFAYQTTPAYALFCTDGVEYVSSTGGRYLNRMNMHWFISR